MVHAIPPQEHAFFACRLSDRKPLMRHGVAEIAMRWSASAADAENGKKVSKEIQRERQKEREMDAQRMVETTDAIMGGYGYWTSEAKGTKEAVGPERFRQLQSFLRFKRTLERQRVPELRQEVQEKMLEKFGTTDYQTYKAEILKEASADPELDVLVRNGQVIKTSREAQYNFARERNATAVGAVKR
jgi:hypothetical protein